LERNFFTLLNDSGQNAFINFDQIRMVIRGPDGCEVWLGETLKIHIAGPAMGEFLERIGERSIALKTGRANRPGKHYVPSAIPPKA
jgi:hypothetical protein